MAPPDKSRSPSPTTTSAPTPSAPGERATRLLSIFDEALKHTLKPCTYDNFSACFPTPAAHEPAALRDFYDTFVARLDAQCRLQFAQLVEERDVVRRLNRLDALIKDADRRRAARDPNAPDAAAADQAPPHLLPPDAVLAAHLQPFVDEQTNTLQARLVQVQDGNAALAERIAAQRAEMDTLLGGLEAVVADVEGAAAALRDAGDMQGVEADLEAYAKVVGAG